MRRGYEHTGPPSSADTRASPSLAHSTLKALSANHQAFSSVASPSFTDYRNSALSPSGFDSHHSDVSSARVPIYTEAEREAARYSLLGQLASQLGTPTPPSAGESSDDGATDDGTSRQDSGRELMNLIKQQLDDVQPYGDKVPVKYQQRASETPSMALPHPAQPQRQSPGRSSQHMLSILNGTSGSSPWLAPQHPPATQLSGSGISPSDGGLNALPAVSNPADHTSSLLNLFNSQSKPTISQTAALNAPSPGHIDIARLFADVRL